MTQDLGQSERRRQPPVSGRRQDVTACEWRVGSAASPELPFELRIAERSGFGGTRYAVTWMGRVANRDCEWEWEPQPSSRDDAFFERCRFDDWEEAYQVAIRMPLEINGSG